MSNEGTTLKKENKAYKVALILLIGLAVLSGARKDLNELRSLASDVHAFTNHWLGGIMPLVHARPVATAEVCNSRQSSLPATSDQFRWSGRVEQGKTIEIK